MHASAIHVASSLGWFTNISTFIRPCVHAKSLQSCPTLCNPMNCSLPGSSVHRILQARILKWVAVSSSRGSSQTRDRIHFSWVSCIGRWVRYHSCHGGSCLHTCKMAIYLPSHLFSPGPPHFSEYQTIDNTVGWWGCEAIVFSSTVDRTINRYKPWRLRWKESSFNAGDLGLIPGTARSPREGNGDPLQYSGLKNAIDRGAWQVTVHGVAKSQTRLSN